MEWKNSGSLVGVFSGNDSPSLIEDAINGYLGKEFTATQFTKIDAPATAGNGFSLTYSTSRLSGTWSSSLPIAFYSVKAATQWALYHVDPSATDGTWSTEDLRTPNGKNIPAISHITGIQVPGGPAPVPEPGTMALLGLGLAGMAGYRRIRKR
jgi:hypothetical protein